jgi:ABC-type antimicrobial peptide transport system permease subunit
MTNPAITLVIFAIAIGALVVLTARFKFHAFIVILFITVVMGLAAGLNPQDVIGYIVEGFGGMMGGNVMETLISAFLNLGLLVGVASLRVIALRAVVQRRQEIGVLRAIGFKRRAILLGFLLETSFVALLGMAIGLSLGLLLSRFQIYPQFEGLGASFVIPWPTLLVVGIAYLATLLCTA